MQPDLRPSVDQPSDLGQPPSRTPDRRQRSRWMVVTLATILLVVALGTVLRLPSALTTGTATPAPTVTPVPQYTAHGVVRPASEARLGALTAGTVVDVLARPGRVVDASQELALVSGPGGTDVITAPWRGTVADVMVQVGDTVVPGTTLIVLDDLSRLQVQTTDVDEFLISHVRPGEAVSMKVEALNGRQVTGQVQTVALEPRLTASGDSFYPVVISLAGSTAGLEPGMTVDITFPG